MSRELESFERRTRWRNRIVSLCVAAIPITVFGIIGKDCWDAKKTRDKDDAERSAKRQEESEREERRRDAETARRRSRLELDGAQLAIEMEDASQTQEDVQRAFAEATKRSTLAGLSNSESCELSFSRSDIQSRLGLPPSERATFGEDQDMAAAIMALNQYDPNEAAHVRWIANPDHRSRDAWLPKVDFVYRMPADESGALQSILVKKAKESLLRAQRQVKSGLYPEETDFRDVVGTEILLEVASFNSPFVMMATGVPGLPGEFSGAQMEGRAYVWDHGKMQIVCVRPFAAESSDSIQGIQQHYTMVHGMKVADPGNQHNAMRAVAQDFELNLQASLSVALGLN